MLLSIGVTKKITEKDKEKQQQKRNECAEEYIIKKGFVIFLSFLFFLLFLDFSQAIHGKFLWTQISIWFQFRRNVFFHFYEKFCGSYYICRYPFIEHTGIVAIVKPAGLGLDDFNSLQSLI